jgi:hypothetical protein
LKQLPNKASELSMHSIPKVHHIAATVTDVLPCVGLAYLAGDDGGDWTVTKGTPGGGLKELTPGAKVKLVVHEHTDFAYVAKYMFSD